jgi:predicted MFS family arabinose efflux permease
MPVEGEGGATGPSRDAALAQRRKERAILLVLSAVQFTSVVDFMVVMPLGPTLMRTLGISPSQFSWIVSSYTYSASVSGLLAAFLVDRFDRKTSFLSLYAGFLIGNLLCALAPGYGALLAARVFTGAFGGILGGLALAIVGDVFPESKRGSATGQLMSAFAVASVVGVPFGLELGNSYGWNAPFLFLAGLGSIVLVVGVRALPAIRGHLDHRDAGTALQETWGIVSDPNHLRAFALVVTLMVGGFTVIPYIATYLVRNVGVTNEQVPLIYVAGGALSLFGAPAIGKLADRFGKLQVYRVVAPIAAVLMIVVTNLPPVSLTLAVGVVGLLMVANAGRMVAAMAMVTSCVEPRRRGRFMSMNASVQHFSAGLGSTLGGYLLGETTGGGALTGYGKVGLLAVAVTALSLFLAGRLRPAHQGEKPDVSSADSDDMDAVAAASYEGA